MPDIFSEEAFPSLNNIDFNKMKKRIKPTSIEESKKLPDNNNPFIGGEDSLVVNSEQNDDYFKKERDLLKKIKSNILSTKNSSNKVVKCFENSDIKQKNITAIEPNFELITFKSKLDAIIELYCFILMNNYCQNLFEEVKFILEILSKKLLIKLTDSPGKNKISIESLFRNYHNCYYFCHSVFQNILISNHFISCFNINALHYLLENLYLINFRKDFNFRSAIIEILSKKISTLTLYNDATGTDNNFVIFHPDTDGRINFPNDRSFSMFRKQRDEFYRLYEKYNRMWLISSSNDKIILKAFHNDIQNIFSPKEVGNFYHLARLFVEQLLMTCRKAKNRNVANKIIQSNESERILVDQDRLNKLENRFLKNRSEIQDRKENLFDENFEPAEKFFRDFIFYGDSHSFNEQLKLVLKHRLIESLNNLIESKPGTEMKRIFFQYLTTVCILGKFSGFVSFYSLETERLELIKDTLVHSKFVEQQQNLRSLNPNYLFDIETIVIESMQNNSLIINLPWIVEYLTFVDHISLTSKHYSNIFSLLVLVYKYYLPNLIKYSSIKNSSNNYYCNRIFMQFCLEKLFLIKKINVLNHIQVLIANSANQSDLNQEMFKKCLIGNGSFNCFSDFNNELIDLNSISLYFPYFTKILIQLFQQYNSDIRKITPTTLNKVNLTKQNLPFKIDNYSMNLTMKIEDCFMNANSNTFRKNVCFLNDKITDNCIKKLKNIVYPKIRNEHCNQIENETEIQPELVVKIHEDCKIFIDNYVQESTKKIYPEIIGEDFKQEKLDFIIKLSIPKIVNTCNDWLEKNITDIIIKKDYSRKFNLEKLSNNNNEFFSTENFQCYANGLYNIKQLMNNLINGNTDNINADILVDHLEQIKLFHNSNLELLILDLALVTIIFLPDIFDDFLLNQFINYWNSHHIQYQKVINHKYLFMISQLKSPDLTWIKYEYLLKRMLKENIYDFINLEQDTISVLKEDWNEEHLNRFSGTLKSLVAFLLENNLIDNSNKNETEILEWLAWICQETRDHD